MQSRGDAPHCVVSHNPSQAERCDHLSEGCVGRDDAQGQTGGHTCRVTAEQCEQFFLYFCAVSVLETTEYEKQTAVHFITDYVSMMIQSCSENSKN